MPDPVSPPTPTAPTNFAAGLGTLGSALASGVLGRPDPIQQEQDRSFRRSVELFRLRQSVQDQRTRTAQLGIELFKGVLTDPHSSQAAKEFALKGWTGALKGLGVSVDPAFSNALLQRRLSIDDVEKIGTALAKGVPQDFIRREYPSLTPQELHATTALSQSPPFLRAHKMKTPDELHQEATKAQRDDLSFLFERYGLTRGARAESILQKAVTEHGKSFGDLTPPQQAKLFKATEGMGLPKTTLVKNALSEMGLDPGTVQDPVVIQEALTRHTARVTKAQLDLAANKNQLTVAGAMYRKALTDSQQDFSRLARVESLERDMIRLIREGRELGLTTNPKFVNAAQQELASWTASGGQGLLTRQADWVRRFGIVDAQFAVVAQAFERITGNRLAQTLVTLARGFHPKITDPYEVQKGVVMELHRKLKENRAIAAQDLARAQNLYDQVLKLTGTSVQGVIPDEAAVDDQSGTPPEER